MSTIRWETVIKALGLTWYFRDILGYDDWDKTQNIHYVLKKYNLNPKDVLFIDDNINHINKVGGTWVNTLHFIDKVKVFIIPIFYLCIILLNECEII